MYPKIKNYSFLFALFIAISNLYAADFAGGNGTADDPFLISTPEHLDNVRKYLGETHADKHFKLTNDIDLGVAPYNEGEGWNPIGYCENDTDYHYPNAFFGNMYGDNYNVKNLSINRPDADYQGLFGIAKSGKIEALNIVDCNIKGGNYTAGLAGFNYVAVSHCYVTGQVDGKDYVGGLVGQNTNVIRNCYSTANVSGHNIVGGLVGYIHPLLAIAWCYATGNVTATGSEIGGLVGKAGGWIEHCYATGNVSGDENVGGLVGNISDAGYGRPIFNCYASGNVSGRNNVHGLVGWLYMGSVRDCIAANSSITADSNAARVVNMMNNTYPEAGHHSNYALSTMLVNGKTVTNGTHDNEHGEDKTLEELTNVNSYKSIGWDFNKIWTMEEGKLPTLQIQPKIEIDKHKIVLLADSSYKIKIMCAPANATIPKMAWTSSNESIATVDANGLVTAFKAGETIIRIISEDDSFIDSCRVFVAKFAGGNGTENEPFLISNSDELNCVRYYTSILNADKHFRLINDIDLGIAPYNEGWGWEPIGRDDNVYDNSLYTRAFNGKFDGNKHVIKNLTINNSADNESYLYLGLFGWIGSEGIIKNVGIENCNISGYHAIGALTGINSGKIANCYATGNIVNHDDNTYNTTAGGLVGNNQTHSSIENSYSEVVITSNGLAGGLVGWNLSGNIINCYATGNVTGKKTAGGLVGTFDMLHNKIKNCYSTANVKGDSLVGGLVGEYVTVGNPASDDMKIEYCISASQELISSTADTAFTHRIANSVIFYNQLTYSHNYALSSMLVNGNTVTDGTHNDENGEDKTLAELQSQATYEALGWDFDSVWTMAEFPVKPAIGTLAGETVRLPRLKWQPEPTQNIHELPQQAIASIRLYPNPSNEMLTISSIDNKIFKSISLFDMAGKLLAAYSSIDNSIYTIDISQYPVGTYMLNIDGKTVRFVKK